MFFAVFEFFIKIPDIIVYIIIVQIILGGVNNGENKGIFDFL